MSYNGLSFYWDRGRELVSMSGNGKALSFTYNENGIRTKKTVNGETTTYHLMGDVVTYESNENNRIYYTYDGGNNLISMNWSEKIDGTWTQGEEYYYIRNAQNDIIGLVDSSGVKVVSYTYDSWGKPVITDSEENDSNDTIKDGITGSLSDTVGQINPYRYRGYRYDNETGLYYLQSRYYNPEWSRFINEDDSDVLLEDQDSLLQYNLFTYCLNNPVNMRDPNGYVAANIIGGIVGGACIIRLFAC